MNSLAVS